MTARRQVTDSGVYVTYPCWTYAFQPATGSSLFTTIRGAMARRRNAVVQQCAVLAQRVWVVQRLDIQTR